MKKLKKIPYQRTCRINDHPNTFGYALETLYNKGYKVYIIPSEDEHHFGEYVAYKEERDFWASDPLRLLALVTIWEEYGDKWYPTDLKDSTIDKRDLMEDAAFPDDDYSDYSDSEFKEIVQHLRGYYYVLGFELPEEVNRAELAALIAGGYPE